MNIHISNMAYATTNEDLKKAFGRYGPVDRAVVVKDRVTGSSKGYGFVEMPNAAQARAAIENLNGAELDGRKLRVSVANDQGMRQQRERRPLDGRR